MNYCEITKERVSEVETMLLETNSQVKELTKRSFGLFREIRRNMPPEFQRILSDYESTENQLWGMVAQAAYEQGLRDSLKEGA